MSAAAPPDPVVPAWLLSEQERGNPATRLPAWSSGSSAEPLVHGRTYFPRLLAALEDTGPGDLVVFADWRGDPDELLTDDGPTVSEALCAAASRGAMVKGLMWRSHLDRLQFSAEQNRDLSEDVNDAGGEVLLDQRVRPMGSHHQKFVVVRHAERPERDVAFVGGIDLGHGRRDDADHGGDPQPQVFASGYGGSPAWHDVQVELRGPVVADVEAVFRERWEDPAVLSRLPWHVLPDLLQGADRSASRLPEPLPPPPPAGECTVQLLRTYPNRWPGYPFAPDGERTRRARLRQGGPPRPAAGLRRGPVPLVHGGRAGVRRRAPPEPGLHLVAVVPRYPDQDGRLAVAAERHGHATALAEVRAAAGDRFQVLDVENRQGDAVYVHAKVCVVDDVWASIGSDNFNRRSWTHDSELTAAVLDGRRDGRAPADPGGLGDGARVFARDLRLELLAEHLDRAPDDVDDLLDPERAVEAVRRSAEALEAWHRGGRQGPRPPGRLRPHSTPEPARRRRGVAALSYRLLFDPDGRPPLMKLQRRM